MAVYLILNIFTYALSAYKCIYNSAFPLQTTHISIVVLAPLCHHHRHHRHHRRSRQRRHRPYLITSRIALPLAFVVGVRQLFMVASWNLLGVSPPLCVCLLRCSLSDIPSFISNKCLKCLK